jgi:hypothetical protein
MTETLPLRIARSKVRFIEEAAGWVRAGETDEFQASAAEAIVLDCSALPELIKHVWGLFWKEAEAGRVQDFDATGAILDEILGVTESALQHAIDAARSAGEREGRTVAGLTELEEQATAFADWSARAKAAWPRPSKFRPPLDRERIARAYAALDRGEGEDTAEIIARLEAGGPLVKE